MLEIIVPENELWNEESQEFIPIHKTILKMEHSLVSLHKWESKWHKPWMSKREKTYEEQIDYYKFMTITQNVDDVVYLGLTADNVRSIENYINDPMTAATFKADNSVSKSNEFISAESLYFAMINNGIPFECQKWHLNQLISLIRFCNAKNQPAKKKSTNELIKDYSSINARNRALFKTRG